MRQQESGYTLLELLVVIAILSLITALAAPAVTRTLAGTTINADARRLAEDLRQLKRIAEERQQTIIVSSDGTGLKIDPAAGIPLPTADTALADREHPLVYFADGTTSGGTLRISEDGRSLVVDVAWLTGSVSIGDANASR
jgi:general secretion pathway protein H